MSNKNKNTECLIIPLGNFGDHDLGYSGCVWCEQKEACMKHNSNIGKSLIMKQPTKRFIRRVKQN